MKRYNIHLPESWIPEIQKIREAILKTNQSKWFWANVTVADLIRIAIAARFNLRDPEVHASTPAINNAITRVFMRRKFPTGRKK